MRILKGVLKVFHKLDLINQSARRIFLEDLEEVNVFVVEQLYDCASHVCDVPKI